MAIPGHISRSQGAVFVHDLITLQFELGLVAAVSIIALGAFIDDIGDVSLLVNGTLVPTVRMLHSTLVPFRLGFGAMPVFDVLLSGS